MTVTKQVLENISFVDSLSITYLGSNFKLVGADADYFKLETGPLGGVNLVFRDAPDFEAPAGGHNNYSFTVEYKNLFGQSKSDTYKVQVNDVNEAPTGMSSTTFKVDENTTARTKVAHVDVVDPDTNPAFHAYDFALLTLDNRFEVDSKGDVYLKANKVLDYESGPICITVVAADKQFPLYLAATTITLDVNDVDEAPTALKLSNVLKSIDENDDAGKTIAKLSVVDPDTNPEFRSYDYKVMKMVGGDLIADARFSADKNGVYLNAGASLDYESESSVSLWVTAQAPDGTIVGQQITFSVNDKNDKPTELNVKGALSVAENTKVETVLADVAVTDEDQSADFNQYDYSVSDNRFAVKDGKLVLLADKDVNFEDATEKGVINVVVTATDAHDPTIKIETSVAVAVVDVNEAPTSVVVFGRGEGGESGPQISFPENTSTKTELASVLVFGDPDTTEQFTAYTYKLSDDRFAIENGKLYLKAGQSTDFETEPKIKLGVTVHDGDFSISTDVIINVTDVDESDSGPGGAPGAGPNAPTPTPHDGFDGSIPALIVSSFVEGVIPATVARLESLSNFAEDQFLAYQERGVQNPSLGSYEALGLGFSVTTEFQDKYGALTEPAFILKAYADVFGRQATGAQADHFQAQIDYFEMLYAGAHIPEATAEMMAKGAALGQMLGFAVLEEADKQPYLAQAQAFLADAADGVVTMGKPLAFYDMH